MLILEKKLKQNFIKTHCNICQVGFKISYFFSHFRKLFKLGFFHQSKKYHSRLLFWYGIREIHGTRNKRLRL